MCFALWLLCIYILAASRWRCLPIYIDIKTIDFRLYYQLWPPCARADKIIYIYNLSMNRNVIHSRVRVVSFTIIMCMLCITRHPHLHHLFTQSWSCAVLPISSIIYRHHILLCDGVAVVVVDKYIGTCDRVVRSFLMNDSKLRPESWFLLSSHPLIPFVV